MGLRHTATLKFDRGLLNDSVVASRLGLTAQADAIESEVRLSQSVPRRSGRDRFSIAVRRMEQEFRKAESSAADPMIVDLDIDACDALLAKLAEARVEVRGSESDTHQIDLAFLRVQSEREMLAETFDAWLDADDMPLETINLTEFERSEVGHWVEICETEFPYCGAVGIAPDQMHAAMRMIQQFNRSYRSKSFTGDLGSFNAMRSVLQDGQEIAPEWEDSHLMAAERRYELLMGKVEDGINSLEMLESDQPWLVLT